MDIDEDVVIVKRSPGPRERSVVSFHHVSPLVLLRPEREGGGGKSRFSSFHIFDQSCWRRTRRKKTDRNLTLRF